MNRLLTFALVAMISMSCKTKQQPIEPKRMKKTSEHVSANAKVHACQTDDECSFTIEIKSLKGTHINREYPHRFMPMLKDVLLLGSEMTYKNDNEGLLTLKYKRTLNTPFVGELSTSACDEEACFIEKLSF